MKTIFAFLDEWLMRQDRSSATSRQFRIQRISEVSCTLVFRSRSPRHRLHFKRLFVGPGGTRARFRLKTALSPLQFQLAHEIAFSKRRALVAQNVVGCGRMEKEVRQRERHQKSFRREWKRPVADPEGEIAWAS